MKEKYNIMYYLNYLCEQKNIENFNSYFHQIVELIKRIEYR